ncbi:MAG: NAD-dependent succinate-semialdehyde dehydrogenase [Microbacteriaceae bacterium]
MPHLDEAALLARIPTALFIDGQWVAGSDGVSIPVHDPATGAVLVSVADATVADGVSALDAAVAAQESWGRTAPRYRAELLRAAFDQLTARADEFALLMSLEMGKPVAEARGEVTYAAEFLRWFSEEAVRIDGRYGSNPEGTGRAIVTHLPVGPAFLITPWNFPLAMATRKIAPAMAAGCTSVIKPATLTPLTTLLFVELLDSVGVPNGVVNAINTSRTASVSERIIRDSRLRKLSFTGSTGVGQLLMKQAADTVLRTSMELGGNAPFVVFEDANLDLAVEGAMQAKFRNIGQACTAANRFIVHRSLAEEFTSKVTERVRQLTLGRGTDAGVTIGPLIDDRAVAKAAELVSDAVSRGAQLTIGGKAIDGPGSFFEPTVLAEVQPGSAILTEEIFGPVLAVATFDTEDEAVALANDTEYGLVGYVYTEDLRRGQRLIETLQTGMMGLNAGVISNASAPFGGIKMSGIGREGGAEGIHEYLSTKYTMTPNPFA